MATEGDTQSSESRRYFHQRELHVVEEIEPVVDEEGNECSSSGVPGAGTEGEEDDSNETGGVGGNRKGNGQDSRRDYHRRILAELDQVLPDDTTEEITIPPDLRQSLPLVVESLLSRLESPSLDDPVRKVTWKDLQGPGFSDLFPVDRYVFEGVYWQRPNEWIAAVRLLIMMAIGNCQTLEVLKLQQLPLTVQEWKAVLEPLQTSSVLRKIDLTENRSLKTKEGCKLVVNFLKGNLNLRTLLTTDGDAHFIRSFLVTCGHPTLEKLSLRFRYYGVGSSAEEIVSEEQDKMSVIRACPNLRQMKTVFWEMRNEEMASMYLQVLLEHHCFRNLNIRGSAGTLSTFLHHLCKAPRLEMSLTGLCIESEGDQRFERNTLKPVFATHRSIEQAKFIFVHTVSEEWQGVFQSLKENDALRTLGLETPVTEIGAFDARACEEMLALVKKSSKLESLRFYVYSEYKLAPLLDVVRSHKKIGRLGFSHVLGTPDESKALASLIEKSTSVTVLDLTKLQGWISRIEKNSSVPVLHRTNLQGWNSWKEIFSSLRSNTMLTRLVLRYVWKVDDLALEELLSSLQANSSLREIDFRNSQWKENGKEVVIKYALQQAERQRPVSYAFISSSTLDKRQGLHSLRQNPLLRCFFLSLTSEDARGGFNPEEWNLLHQVLGESSTLESLTVFRDVGGAVKHDDSELLQLISSLKMLRSLTLLDVDVRPDENSAGPDKNAALRRLIRENTGLTELGLIRSNGVEWGKFFQSLRYNGTLQYLRLSWEALKEDDAFRELLAALQVNSSLKDIKLGGQPLGMGDKITILKEALKQKGRRENYMAEIRKVLGGEDSNKSNTGRIFLCGPSGAGKTQLRLALTQAVSQRSSTQGRWISCFPQSKDLRRTQGIEIQLLDIDSLQVSVWDLAGQDIFRALQDILFPTLKLACIFLLVFSPFDREKQKLKSGLCDRLREELRPWLRFIASNSRLGSYILPQLKVIISHKDKLELAKIDDISWATDTVNDFRSEFTKLLQIDLKVFCVDSTRLSADITDVLDSIGGCLNFILEETLFCIPNTCCALERALGKRSVPSTSIQRNPLHEGLDLIHRLLLLFRVSRKYGEASKQIQPILSTSEFFQVCQQEVPSLRKFNCTSPEVQEFMKSLAEYLHDAGTIIYFGRTSQLDLIIVNPNWFTFSFMGRLIGTGHGLPESLFHMNLFSDRKDGLVSRADFSRLLKTFSRKLSNEGYCFLETEVLQKLMEEVDLCFSVEVGTSASSSATYYFAPAVFAEEQDQRSSSEGLRQLPVWTLTRAHSDASFRDVRYMGIRVECQDKTMTMLTPALFPRFQVYFRNLLISRRGLREDQIRCDYNMVHIFFGQYEIYIENDGNSGDHIDVLVQSRNSRSQTFKFIQENVVNEIQAFRASPKGCPGVTLAVGVLRSECVRNLTLSVYRNTQSILVEELKKRWKEDLKTRWQKEILDQETVWKEENSDYDHVWPRNEEARLVENSESARELLSDEDCTEVLSTVKASVVHGVMESLRLEADRLESVKKEIAQEVKARFGVDPPTNERDTRTEVSSSEGFPFPLSSGNSRHRRLRRNLSDLMTSDQRILYDIQQMVYEIREDVKESNSILREMYRVVKEIRYYQSRVSEMMVSMNRQLDQLTGFTADLHARMSGVPNRPYFTSSDVRCGHRITAAVRLGKAMVLHFMCEERSGNHFVPNQPGYEIIVLEKDKEFLRSLSINSLKVLWYLLKAGVEVATGLGGLIPELDTGETTTELTVDAVGNLLSDRELKVAQRGMVNSSTEDAWRYLKDVLVSSLKGQCGEYFLLYPVRYKMATESSSAWLCRQCLEKNVRMGTVV